MWMNDPRNIVIRTTYMFTTRKKNKMAVKKQAMIHPLFIFHGIHCFRNKQALKKSDVDKLKRPCKAESSSLKILSIFFSNKTYVASFWLMKNKRILQYLRFCASFYTFFCTLSSSSKFNLN